ncbi:MAG: diaminopimelate decarboxylase [Chloroflexi bacterium]|nr:diaminopimelate decarboxylase [Chloroflexota bacterium]
MRGVDALPVFPTAARVNGKGHLEMGGVDAVELAGTFGTPLYVCDEATLREAAQEFRREFEARYPQVQVAYACKAFANVSLARLLAEEGLGFDVVSGGEIAVLKAAELPLDGVYFHGNNKAAAELRLAVDSSVGRIVVDNLHELGLLERVLEEADRSQKVLLRVSPGVDPHTHSHTTTGVLDSKFGLTIATGQAEEALAQALRSPRIEVAGLHFHLGSPVWETAPYAEAIAVTLDFAHAMGRKHGFVLKEFSPGGGFPVRYLMSDPEPSVATYARVLCDALRQGCEYREMPLPRLSIEPGRAVVGRAGVAFYTIGAKKEIPNLRTYVAVDGGMGDNIRPAIYGSRYEAVLANRMGEPETGPVTIAGKYCESGDVLVRDCFLPAPRPGDIVAIPVSGAYCLAMSSNYNAMPRPAVLLVGNGRVRLLRRRETYDDLLRADLL